MSIQSCGTVSSSSSDNNDDHVKLSMGDNHNDFLLCQDNDMRDTLVRKHSPVPTTSRKDREETQDTRARYTRRSEHVTQTGWQIRLTCTECPGMIHGYLESCTPPSSAAWQSRWWHSHSSPGLLSGSGRLSDFSAALGHQCPMPFSKEYQKCPSRSSSWRGCAGTAERCRDVRSKQMMRDSLPNCHLNTSPNLSGK